MDNVKVGKNYKWKDRNVFVRANPLMQAIGPNQSPVWSCEVLILPDGQIDFAPVSELTLTDDPPHLIFTMKDGKPIAAVFDNDKLTKGNAEKLYAILVDHYPPIASTHPVIAFRRGKNIIGMHMMLVRDAPTQDVPSTNGFAPEKAEEFCRSLYGDIPKAIHPTILVSFDQRSIHHAAKLSVFDARAAITLGVAGVFTEVRGNQLILTNPLASDGYSGEERIPITADSVAVRHLENALERMGARY